MKKRDRFIFRRSFIEAISLLSDEEQLRLYQSICGYALDGATPELTGLEAGYFALIKTQIETDIVSHESGKKGGRPKKVQQEDSPKKEIKGIEFVTLTEKQYESAKAKYGEEVVLLTLQYLDNWFAKGSKAAKQYIGKNNYGFFRSDSWALVKALEELNKTNQPNWSV